MALASSLQLALDFNVARNEIDNQTHAYAQNLALLSAAALGVVNIIDSHLISKRMPSLKAFGEGIRDAARNKDSERTK